MSTYELSEIGALKGKLKHESSHVSITLIIKNMKIPRKVRSQLNHSMFRIASKGLVFLVPGGNYALLPYDEKNGI